MSTLLTVILPFFALILCGWIGARRNLVSAAGITGLNGFVYWFALPAMLFLGLYSQPIDALFQPRYVLAYALVGIVPFLAILTLARGSLAELTMQALASVYSNTGYMGIPLLVALLGREATGPAVLIVVADLVVSVPATIALMEVTRGDAGSPLAALRQVARGFIGSPLLWSIMLGFAASAVHLRLPVAVDSFLHLIGSGAGPVALFAIGGSLAQCRAAARRFHHHYQARRASADDGGLLPGALPFRAGCHQGGNPGCGTADGRHGVRSGAAICYAYALGFFRDPALDPGRGGDLLGLGVDARCLRHKALLFSVKNIL